MINHIWVDADSCPLLVRNHVDTIGKQKNIPVTFVANKQIPNLEVVITDNTKDSADNYILEHAESGDLVITKDIVFADKLVQKEITVINDRGTRFTKEIIQKRLEDRDFDMQLANIGLVKHFHEGYGKEKFSAFKKCFNEILS